MPFYNYYWSKINVPLRYVLDEILCEPKIDEYREALIRYVKELQTRMITPESGGYCSSSNASCTDYSDTDSSDESVDEETVPDQAR